MDESTQSLDFEDSFTTAAETSQNSPENGPKEDEPPFICLGCKKEYKTLKNKKRHMEKCKKIVKNEGESEEETNETLDETTEDKEVIEESERPVKDIEENNGVKKKESDYTTSSQMEYTSSSPQKEDGAEEESDHEEFTMIDKCEGEEAEREEKRLKEEMEKKKEDEEKEEKEEEKEKMDVEKVQVDVLELNTGQDEIDMTLDNEGQSDGECTDNDVPEKKTDKPAAVPEKVEEKKILQPPVIHNRTFKMGSTIPAQVLRQWNSSAKEPANITTTLLKDLIDVKLSIEEDKKEEEEKLRKSRTTKPSKEEKPVRTKSKEKKSKDKRKKREDEDNELDFEPGTESEDDSIDVKTGLTKDPTAFPLAPLEPVPKSRKEPNRALLLTNLVRPFTILQLKSMLSHCGKVKSIWINTIKSRCYAVFASIEEATRARETIHGAVWPSTSPKTLNVDYAEDERMYSETDGELVGDNIDITVIEEQKRKKPKKDKERKKQKTDEDDSPANILDTLFKKTKASPCIYWLPLSEEKAKEREEVKAKQKPRYFEPEPFEEEPKPRPRAIPKWSPARRAAAAERRDNNRRRPRSSDRSRR